MRKVADLSAARAGSEERFSLLFSGPRRAKFSQDTSLTVTHPILGRFPLAIVPVGARKRGQYYEAIVNRTAP